MGTTYSLRMQLVSADPVHPCCRPSKDLFSGTKFPFAFKNGGLSSHIPRDLVSPYPWWCTGTAAPSNESPSLVVLPHIIPQVECSCLLCCLPPGLILPFASCTSMSRQSFCVSQTNYSVTRGHMPLLDGSRHSTELHGDQQNKCQHRAIRPAWKRGAFVRSRWESIHAVSAIVVRTLYVSSTQWWSGPKGKMAMLDFPTSKGNLLHP